MASASFASGQDEFARHAELAASFPFVERHRPRGGGDTGLLVREPVGVVGAIIPWNGPSFSIAVKCAPALLAGCTIVLKSSPEAPGDGYVLAEFAETVGLPAGVLTVSTADRLVSAALVLHTALDEHPFNASHAAVRNIGHLHGNTNDRCPPHCPG